jgi:hypothetical protein
MFECNRDVTARSLNAIYRWTSPVEFAGRGLCDLLLVLRACFSGQRLTAERRSDAD